MKLLLDIKTNGESYITTAVEIFNPKNPQDPQDGNEKLTLMVTLGKMNPHIFKMLYLDDPESRLNLYRLAERQLLITIAQEGGHFEKAKYQNDAYDISSLDSLLGMEGEGMENLTYANGIYNFSGAIESGFSRVNDTQTVKEIPIAMDENSTRIYFPIPEGNQSRVYVAAP